MHECDAQALDDDRVNGQGPRQGTWQEPVSGNRQATVVLTSGSFEMKSTKATR